MRVADVERFWSKVDVKEDHECWPWTGAVGTGGYGRFSMGGRGAGMLTVSRVSYEIATGRTPECVRHSCDNRLCVNPGHLSAGSHADNMRDMALRERSRTTKLDASTVLAIRDARARGERQVDVARDHGVSPATVSDIVARRTWAHVP